MYFSEFNCQDSSKNQLLNLFSSSRVPHALLLSGPEGCGHLQLALSFSTLILCQSPKNNDACKGCSSCKMNEKYQHPDLHFSFPIHLLKSEHSEVSDDRRKLFISTLQKEKCLGKKSWYSLMGNENKQINEVYNLDLKKRETQTILDELSSRMNTLSSKIGLLYKNGDIEKANILKSETSSC